MSITDGESGTNAGTITADYAANATGSQREGTITVSASGATGSPKVVTVTQLDEPPVPALWFEDTFEPNSPAVRWDSGDYKYMNSYTHGDGTLQPFGGGYKVGYDPDGQLGMNAICGSHFTGVAHGLWATPCRYTLLADPNSSRTWQEQARFDIRFLTVGGGDGVTFYIGQTSVPYSALVGDAMDMLAYGMVRFTTGSAGKANVQLLGTVFTDAVDIDWNQTYQVIANFDVPSDTATLSVTDGTNILATETGAITTQMGASTMSALNGWVCATTSGTGLGLDNFIFENLAQPSCGDLNPAYPVGDIDGDCYVNLTDVFILSRHWLVPVCTPDDWCEGADLNQSGRVDLNDFGDLVVSWLDCTDPAPPCNQTP